MMGKAASVVIAVFVFSLLGAGCHRGEIKYPAVPPVTVTATPAPAGADYTQKLLTSERQLKKRVAVARFRDNIPVEESPFGAMRETHILGPDLHVETKEVLPEASYVSPRFHARLLDALSRTERFVLVERTDINSILRELSFKETKWVDQKNSARIGKVLGAQIIVTGAYARNEDPKAGGDKKLALFLRMYDVETSRIVGTARALGATEQQVIDRAVETMTWKMDQSPWVGKVASISGEKIYLNAGRTENVHVGDQFNLFSLGKPIQDPDSRETIGYQEEPAGRAEVVAVAERVSTLKMIRKVRAIKIGDKVAPVESN